MKRLVTIQEATGNVVSEWSGGAEQDLAPRTGYAYIDVSGTDLIYIGKRWNGTAFEAIPPAPVRILSAADFVRRFTMSEETAIDTLADSNRTVKAWMRRLTLVQTVNLDHADVVAGLAYLKSVGIPSVWPDTATADLRIAAIRA